MDHTSSHSHPANPEQGASAHNNGSSPDGGGTLPDGYGDNRLVLLPRDPFWFFSYWELTSEHTEAIRRDFGNDVWDKGALVLRAYDVTESEIEGTPPAAFTDTEVQKQARQWYVRVPKSGRAYVADLGLRMPDGRFISLLRSNRIRLPIGKISDKTDSQWMAVGVSEQAQWNKFLESSAGLEQSSNRGSAEISRNMAQRWEFLRSVFSGSSSSLSGSSTWVAPTPLPPEEKK
jgi:hypothetical protein